MGEFAEYVKLKAGGANPVEVYHRAKTDGVNRIAMVRLLRQVFDLDLAQAKEVIVIGEGDGSNLSEYQEKLLPGLAAALKKDA